jgi:ribose-phosphate pyrophosphokinase
MAELDESLKVFSGSSHPRLAQAICDCLGIPLGEVYIHRYANDNIFVQIRENVREKDVFVVQTAVPPVNEMIMELLIMIDALRSASAHRITAVLPYYPYARSDKKDMPRISIAARLIADLLRAAGAQRVLTMTLHTAQIHGFFDMPLDHLLATPLLCGYFADRDLSDYVAVAPDAGSARRAGPYAETLGIPLAIGDKRRLGHSDRVEIVRIVGDVKGKKAIVFDDEIATGASLMEIVRMLEKESVQEIYAAAAHGLLCGPAIERIQNSSVRQVVVTDTLPLPAARATDKIKVVSVAPVFAEAIKRIHTGESVSSLF